ncbi:phage tail protein [Pseudomonas sp. RW3S2]|uniref:phage tail protein n=1 Tax=Pseudomonas sp. RW3S2 TaxID=485884 RepID=UPI001647ABE8|nr:phage tail protein [Pseudomonas sp. RW3S2]MBC3420524.1 phage tail protein [Pseudomonas sp. RW3S2]
MDYPKSTPNVGLVGGKFVDENAGTGQPGSLIPASWGNAVTDELLAVIKAAGLVPSEGDLTQLQKAIQSLAASDVKRTVRVATTGAIALSGGQTIDGIMVGTGDRVLVKDQAAASQNGIYSVVTGAWVRALDLNESAECTPGHLVLVENGTANAGSIWQLSNTTLPTLGTTALVYTRMFGKTGVAAGTYRSVSVDVQGRVTAGSNPTTVDGYGITDAVKTSSGVSSVPGIRSGAMRDLAVTQFVTAGDATTDKPAGFSYGSGFHIPYPEGKMGFDFLSAVDKEGFFVRKNAVDGTGTWRELWHTGNFDPTQYATKTQMDTALEGKANNATSLAGYGITDAYTKSQINSSLNSKANAATTLAGYGITDAYTKAQIDSSLASKANSATTIAGYGITDAYTKAQLDSSLNSKAAKATTLDGYGITDAVSKSGGTISGAIKIAVEGQDVSSAALNLNNPLAGGAAILRLSTPSSAVALLHSQNTNILAVRNAANNSADLEVGSVLSNGAVCHTAASFLKPVAGQFVVLQGAGQLPAGGTWAYFTTGYNGSGGAVGGTSGVSAGGAVVGYNSNSVGFAWRIQ